MLWAWIELLALAVDRDRAERPWPAVRLGIAARRGMAAPGQRADHGPAGVARPRLGLSPPAPSGGAHRGEQPHVAVLLTVGPLYSILDVQGASIEPAQVFLPDVAASLSQEPETFSDEDLDLVESVAPPIVWTTHYDCYDSTPLLFHPMFDQAPVRRVTRRLFAASRSMSCFVTSTPSSSIGSVPPTSSTAPAQPADAFFHRPPYDFPPNTVGLARAPISDSRLRRHRRDLALGRDRQPALAHLATRHRPPPCPGRGRRLRLPGHAVSSFPRPSWWRTPST